MKDKGPAQQEVGPIFGPNLVCSYIRPLVVLLQKEKVPRVQIRMLRDVAQWYLNSKQKRIGAPSFVADLKHPDQIWSVDCTDPLWSTYGGRKLCRIYFLI